MPAWVTGVRSRSTSSRPSPRRRSEEHTSELQSQSNLVCRLLLEKKKKLWRYLTDEDKLDAMQLVVNQPYVFQDPINLRVRQQYLDERRVLSVSDTLSRVSVCRH